MAIICVSRQIGSLGDEIVKMVSQKTGYSLIDKHEIHEMISNSAADFSLEIKALADEVQPGFFDRFFRNRTLYLNVLSSLVYEVASRDKVIIQGRGAHFLLQNQANVLNIRIVSSFETRIKNIQEKLDTSAGIIEEFIQKKDEEREGFIRYLYKQELFDPDFYDLVINTDKFSISSATQMLVDHIRVFEEEHPTDEATLVLLKALALQKRVEANIQKNSPESIHIDAFADTNGSITLTGYATDESEKKSAEKAAACLPGVTQVNNKILVFRPFQKIVLDD